MTNTLNAQKEKKYGLIIGLATLAVLIFTVIAMLFLPHLSMPRLGKILSNQLDDWVVLDTDSESKISKFEDVLEDIEKYEDNLTLKEEFELVSIYLKYEKFADYDEFDRTYVFNMAIFIAYIAMSIGVAVIAVIFSIFTIVGLIKNNKRDEFIRYIHATGGLLLLFIILLSITAYEVEYGSFLCIGYGIWALIIVYSILLIINRIISFNIDFLSENKINSCFKMGKSIILEVIACAMLVTYFLPVAYYPRGAQQCLESINDVLYQKQAYEREYEAQEEYYIEYYQGDYDDFDDYLDDNEWFQSYVKLNEALSPAYTISAVIGLIIIIGIFSTYILMLKITRMNKSLTPAIITNVCINGIALIMNTINSNKKDEIINKYYKEMEWDVEVFTLISMPMVACVLLGLTMLAIDLWSKKIEKQISINAFDSSDSPVIEPTYEPRPYVKPVITADMPEEARAKFEEAEKLRLEAEEVVRHAEEEAVRKAEEYARLVEEENRKLEAIKTGQIQPTQVVKKIAFCKECGTKLNETARFCVKCGTQINRE